MVVSKELVVEYLRRPKIFSGVVRELKIEIVKGKIISLIGPRRAGKTFFMYYLFNKYEDALYLNFEEVFFKNLDYKEIFEIIAIFKELYGKEPSLLLLDEIQEVISWESVLRTLLDANYDIVVTGSSSKLLSSEIATQLRGRTLSYMLLPFNFREFVKSKDPRLLKHFPLISISEKVRVLTLLEEYMRYGGYPEVVLSNDEELKKKILKTYLEEIFFKDFVERHNIKSLNLGRFLFEFCFQNYSSKMSISKIENYLKGRVPLSKKTLYEYLDLISDTLTVFFLDKYSRSVYVRKSWPKKIYVVDLGLSHYLSFEENVGRKMENLVFLELLRRQNIFPFEEYYFYETKNGYEIDFLIKEGIQIKKLIQVTYANRREDIEEREIRALLHAKKELNLGNDVPLTVITWDYEDVREEKWHGMQGRIIFVPLWKWLLGIDEANH